MLTQNDVNQAIYTALENAGMPEQALECRARDKRNALHDELGELNDDIAKQSRELRAAWDNHDLETVDYLLRERQLLTCRANLILERLRYGN